MVHEKNILLVAYDEQEYSLSWICYFNSKGADILNLKRGMLLTQRIRTVQKSIDFRIKPKTLIYFYHITLKIIIVHRLIPRSKMFGQL